jgi:glycosyltransferase involved in cell wall biosynthesis
MDLVTLSIPVYNVEKYVERALLSALNQTYENIEYLIVDDKGSDNSMNIVREILSTHSRRKSVIIIEHPVNLGLGATRNSAISAAKGDYFFFLDSDDEITSDCIEKLYEEIRKSEGCDLVIGSSKNILGVDVVDFRENKHKHTRDKEQIILDYFDENFSVTVWNTLYKMSLLRDNHISCIHSIMEDNYFTFQVLIYAHAYSVISDITYLRYFRNESITGGNKGYNEKIFMQLSEIFIDLLNFLHKSDLNPQLKIKIKERLFKRRWGISELAMKSPYKVQHYVKEYLSPKLSKDKDVFRSGFLFFAYIISIMPFPIKKIGLLLHMKFMNIEKSNLY